MPGFAVTSSISASEGKAVGVFVKDIGTTDTLLFTAIKKTRISSLVAINKEGGILPVSVFVRRTAGQLVTDSYVAQNTRVFKKKHVILSLVDQDARVSADKMDETPHTEVVLLPGDALYAVSPLDDSFDVTITLSEGIS